jgi:tetratricopeptide (TPR) repeat protein
MMAVLERARDVSLRAAMLAALALALTAPAAHAQAPVNGVRIIELTPHLAVNDAATLIEAEQYADAIVILDTFLATEPARPPEAYYLLGLAHYQLGDYAKALPAAERAATEAADAPASWFELVVALLRERNDYRAAIPWLERLIELAPDTKTYWLELSVAYERAGDYEHALATMRLAHTASLLTEDGELRRLSDLLIHQGIPRQAADVLEQGLAAQTVRADEVAYTKIGTAWYNAGELDKAVLALENASRMASTGDAYARLAVVHVAREAWPAVVSALHAAMERGSLTDAAHADLLMGVALFRQNRYGEAREWLESAAQAPRHQAIAQSYLDAFPSAHVPPVR